jgi:hypothetical protein
LPVSGSPLKELPYAVDIVLRASFDDVVIGYRLFFLGSFAWAFFGRAQSV